MELKRREEEGRPVRIGLIGAGQMGTDIVARAAMMDGMEVAAIADLNPESARRAVRTAYGTEARPADAANAESVDAAIESGSTAVALDPRHILESGLVDVVVDATGVPNAGAELGLGAIEHGKHLVMMNVEADVTIGAYLRSQADRNGVVYSLGAGDEPSACMELVGFASSMGHRIVCVGKGKNNPLDVAATPDGLAEEAAARNMAPRMLAEFVDGSKTMVEMAAVANATGLMPDKPGMHGPSASAGEIAEVLVPARDGGILSGAGRVDYSVGKGLAPGVFAVIEAGHPRVRERLSDLKMGDGPYFALVRPYHLTSLEVPLTCARAVIRGEADMAPLRQPSAEVCAVAKKRLAPGERLDQLGEYCYRAWIMEAGEARAAGAVPCGLLAGGEVTHPVETGELITRRNVRVPAETRIVALRAKQDAMLPDSRSKEAVNG